VPVNSAYNPLFLLGALNSRLFSYLYVNTSTIATKDDFRQTTLAELRRLPIVVINFSDPTDKARHDELVAKVKAMLEAKKQLARAQTDKDKTYYENKCASLDRQIDKLVYDLYGLTRAEIAIVEQTTNQRET
jgi:tRNA G46 methylase TrmB